MRKEEARPRRQFVEHEQLVVGADASVVKLSLALHFLLPQIHKLFVWERNAVHTLQYQKSTTQNRL